MSSTIKLKSTAGGSVSLQVDDTLATDEAVVLPKGGIIMPLRTLVDETANRALATEYTNNTGYEMFVTVYAVGILTSGNIGLEIKVDGTRLGLILAKAAPLASDIRHVATQVIPSGSTYQFGDGTTMSMLSWNELKVV